MSLLNWIYGEKEESEINPEKLIKKADELKDFTDERQKFLELTKDLPKVKEMIGYKAVRHDYRPFFGRNSDVKYEIGKEYSIEGKLIPCKNGFHFCRTLENTMALFPPEKGRRYLKVKCEVPVNYYMNKQGEIHSTYLSCANIAYSQACQEYKNAIAGKEAFTRNQPMFYQFESLELKYITNKMTVLKEVPFKEYADKALDEMIRTEEEYYNTISPTEYSILLNNRIKEYCNGILSDGFISYWITNNKSVDSTTGSIQYLVTFDKFKEKFNAIKDENISQDIRILFMLNKI